MSEQTAKKAKIPSKATKNAAPRDGHLPAPVATARMVLEMLESIEPELNERYKKSLPAYALQQAKTLGDEAITLSFLLQAVQNGDIDTAKPSQKSKQQSKRRNQLPLSELRDSLFVEMADKKKDLTVIDEKVVGHEMAHLARDKGVEALREYLDEPDVHPSQERLNGALFIAAKYGLNDAIGLLRARGAKIVALEYMDKKTALHVAAIYGKALTVRELVAYGADVGAKDFFDVPPIDMAIWGGCEETVLALYDSQKKMPISLLHNLLVCSIMYRFDALFDKILESKGNCAILPLLDKKNSVGMSIALEQCIALGDLEKFKRLHKVGFKIDGLFNTHYNLLDCACIYPTGTPFIEYLVQNNIKPQKRRRGDMGRPSTIEIAYVKQNFASVDEIAKILSNKWEKPLNLYESKCAVNALYFMTYWKRKYRYSFPQGALPRKHREEMLQYYKPALFEEIMDLYKDGLQQSVQIPSKTMLVCALFGNRERVRTYFERWAKPSMSVVDDLIGGLDYDIETNGMIDFRIWGDAILKCGPKMARLLPYAHHIGLPKKSADGKTWSAVETRKAIAPYAFKNALENLELADFCLEYNIKEEYFNDSLDFIANAPTKKSIPDLHIEGTEFDMQGGKFYRLANDDFRGLFLGEITDCCQSITHDHAAPCVEHGVLTENGGFYVVENAKGEILGQCWAWTGEEGELVFDTLETLGNRVTPKQWVQLMHATARELTAKKKQHKVSRLLVGTGGDTPTSILTEEFNGLAENPAIPYAYDSFRESKTQILIWDRQASFAPENSTARTPTRIAQSRQQPSATP